MVVLMEIPSVTFVLLLFFSSSSSFCSGAGGGGAVAGALGSLGVALPGPVLRTWLALDLVLTCFEAKLHRNGSNDYLAEVHPPRTGRLCDNKESVHIANSKTMLAECYEKPSSVRHAF